MSDQLLETVVDGVATLQINRPEVRNALSYELIQELRESVERIGRDPDVRVVVLTGAGKAFCAGGDISDMTSRPQYGIDDTRFEDDVALVRAGMETTRALYEMPKPTLAVMRGTAAGAGLALALACDIRIVVPDAKLTTAFSKIAVSGDFGISFFLPRLVGLAKARELLFFSEVITGQQAADIGLVNRAVALEEIDAEAQSLATRLAKLPTFALGLIKSNLDTGSVSSLGETLDVEAANLVRCFGRDDFASVVARFMAKS